MHETGVCRYIVDTVERYALEGHAKRVTKVNLELGEVHDIVPEILAGAFEWMCRGLAAWSMGEPWLVILPLVT